MTFTDWLPERHVRKVHLRARDETLLRRGSILLEDALHTASIAGEQSGRLLLIRRLDVGRIDSRASPAHLSLAIEQRLWQLGAQTVHAESSAAATASAVYFHDQLEALIILAVRLIQGPEPSEWFWPLAIPDWHTDLPHRLALRRLLATALGTQAGTAAGVFFLKELLARSSLDPVLEALTPQDGPALLQACSWTPSDVEFSLSLPTYREYLSYVLSVHRKIDDAWKSPLRRWVATWGHSDRRSIFLAVVALAAANPARIGSSASLLVSAVKLLQISVFESNLGFLQSPIQSAVQQSHQSDSAQEPELSLDLSVDQTVESIDPKFKYTGPEKRSPYFEGEPTAFAGLFFLLPLLARLGLPAFLTSQPELLELDLPKRILVQVSERLATPPDDQALTVLAPATITSTQLSTPLTFVAPDVWLNTVCHCPRPSRPWQVRRQAGDLGTRLLCDGTGQLALALWHARAPSSLKQFLKLPDNGESIQPDLLGSRLSYPHNPLPVPDALNLLIDSWVIALRRRLRLDSGLALGELVCRSGRLSFTPSHLDITFDLNHSDLRIRKAGLDIDPGWLPWFGRVLKFHYR